VPVVRHEANVLAVPQVKHQGRLKSGFAEHGEAFLVIREIGAVGFAVQFAAGFAPNLIVKK
jgi:hypothetical protein